MAATLTMQLRAADDIKIQAQPLTSQAFSPFGSVVANPRPDVHPSAFAAHAAATLPTNAKAANAGTAIQYRDAGAMQNLFERGRGKPLMSIFACAAYNAADGIVVIDALERHPFTTQTFVPVSSPADAYLVVVAPSLSSEQTDNRKDHDVKLPRWHGMPDLRRLRAFIASASQAITYGAGTWHAPMKVLGEPGQRLDFVVVQFASGVAAEDCQLVDIVSAGGEGEGVRVVFNGLGLPSKL